MKRLTEVFAFNVDLFWVRDCADEVALLHERVLPGGSVYLYYDASRPDQVPTMVEGVGGASARGLPDLRRGAEGARRGWDHRQAVKGFT